MPGGERAICKKKGKIRQNKTYFCRILLFLLFFINGLIG